MGMSDAKKIITKMKKPFIFGKVKLKISTSIGIAFYLDNKTSADELIKQADEALYKAKHAGRIIIKYLVPKLTAFFS